MTGLTNEQVQERIAEGKVNVNENPNTRTYKQIILENTLTFFNFLNIALLVLVLMNLIRTPCLWESSDQYSDRYYSGNQSKEDD